MKAKAAIFCLLASALFSCTREVPTEQKTPRIIGNDSLNPRTFDGDCLHQMDNIAFYIGPTKDTITIESWVRYDTLVIRLNGDSTYGYLHDIFYTQIKTHIIEEAIWPDQENNPDSIKLVVDTTQMFRGRIWTRLWTPEPSLPEEYTQLYPVILTNISCDTMSTNGEFRLVLEVLDSNGKWRRLLEPYSEWTCMGMIYYYWAPGEVVITGLPVTSGKNTRRARLKLLSSKEVYSDTFNIHTNLP